jgi:hypothetical protein
MTEDDTFNRLRRTPIGEMIEIIQKSNIEAGVSFERNIRLLRANGWNPDEYETARVMHWKRTYLIK